MTAIIHRQLPLSKPGVHSRDGVTTSSASLISLALSGSLGIWGLVCSGRLCYYGVARRRYLGAHPVARVAATREEHASAAARQPHLYHPGRYLAAARLSHRGGVGRPSERGHRAADRAEHAPRWLAGNPCAS